MCAINGAFSFGDSEINADYMQNIIYRSTERGRDSFGTYTDGDYWKTTTGEYPKFATMPSKVVLSNNRAEPTTEFVRNKSKDDVQPYADDENDIIVVHNGTIANDKDIAQDLGIDVNIDSKVLAPYFASDGIEGIDDFVDKLGGVIGSYAMAVYDERRNCLYLACNYKPIFICIRDDVLYFSSLEEFLMYEPVIETTIHKMEPYSVYKFNTDGSYEARSLYPEIKAPKTLCVCSGGLDSTVVATKLIRDGHDVSLLHIKYKARAENSEVTSIRNIAKELDVPLIEIETDIFKNVIKASRLTNNEDSIMKDGDGEAGAELAYEWVPARNLIMLSIATGIAEARSFDYIALGNNLEESGAYPDNEQIFIKEFARALPYAVNLGKRVQVLEPVGNLMKHEIVALGLKCKAPLSLTWSCYDDDEKHCGKCGPCYMRKKAFEMNNTPEVIEYQT